MANKKRKHFLALTRPQLIALAVQKKAMPYRDILAMTNEELIALMVDIEDVLTPVKTWMPVDAILDNDQRVIEELAGTTPGTV